MSNTSYITAEIAQGFSLSTGETHHTLTIWTGRKQGSRGLTKGVRAGTIVAPTLVELLRNTADMIEQEDDGWQGVISALERAHQVESIR